MTGDEGKTKRLDEAAWKAAIARERREARQWARVFAEAVRDGDVDRFIGAAECISELTVGGWLLAMKQVAKLPGTSPEIRAAFLGVWIETKMLPLKVGNRRVLADGLRVLMPAGTYQGPPLQLYRGASWGERCRRLYGFSWTRDVEIATKFGEHWNGGGYWGGALLSTFAPAEAVHLFRDDEDYYDEREVVVDPFKLTDIKVVRRFR